MSEVAAADHSCGANSLFSVPCLPELEIARLVYLENMAAFRFPNI